MCLLVFEHDKGRAIIPQATACRPLAISMSALACGKQPKDWQTGFYMSSPEYPKKGISNFWKPQAVVCGRPWRIKVTSQCFLAQSFGVWNYEGVLSKAFFLNHDLKVFSKQLYSKEGPFHPRLWEIPVCDLSRRSKYLMIGYCGLGIW